MIPRYLTLLAFYDRASFHYICPVAFTAFCRSRLALPANPVRACTKILLSFFLFLVLCVSPVSASAEVTTSSLPIHVVGRLEMTLTADQQRVFEQKTVELAAISRKKDSVITYSCNKDIESPGVYVFDEQWPSQKALEDHLNTTHFLAWWDWVQPHLASDLVVEVAPSDAFHAL